MATTAASAICLDQEQTHIVDQNFHLIECHTSDETYLPLSEEHLSALADKENDDCIDVSLTNADTLSRPSKLVVSVNANINFLYTLHNKIIEIQQQEAVQNSSVSIQHLSTPSHLIAHRTVVLLI